MIVTYSVFPQESGDIANDYQKLNKISPNCFANKI